MSFNPFILPSLDIQKKTAELLDRSGLGDLQKVVEILAFGLPKKPPSESTEHPDKSNKANPDLHPEGQEVTLDEYSFTEKLEKIYDSKYEMYLKYNCQEGHAPFDEMYTDKINNTPNLEKGR